MRFFLLIILFLSNSLFAAHVIGINDGRPIFCDEKALPLNCENIEKIELKKKILKGNSLLSETNNFRNCKKLEASSHQWNDALIIYPKDSQLLELSLDCPGIIEITLRDYLLQRPEEIQQLSLKIRESRFSKPEKFQKILKNKLIKINQTYTSLCMAGSLSLQSKFCPLSQKLRSTLKEVPVTY
ncbi:MAG: hypothetical protein AB8E15_00055 [Bdellovibrionales bacterium]